MFDYDLHGSRSELGRSLLTQNIFRFHDINKLRKNV